MKHFLVFVLTILLTSCFTLHPLYIKPKTLTGIERILRVKGDCEITLSDINKKGKMILKSNKTIKCPEALTFSFEPKEMARIEEYIRYLYLHGEKVEKKKYKIRNMSP